MSVFIPERVFSKFTVFLITVAAATAFSATAQAQVKDGGSFYITPSGGSTSYLCGYQPQTGVTAPLFGNWLNSAFDPNGVANVHDADFFFQQCFGGGMINNVISSLGTVPWVAGSASSFNETAQATVSPARGVQPQYASWSVPLVQQLYNNPNQSILTDDITARNNDFFGPNSRYYRETPNYISYNGGNALTLADPAVTNAGGTHYAVIFVGDTGVYGSNGDFTKLGQSMRNVSSDLIKTLSTAWAGSNFQIYLLFGDGTSSTIGYNTASAIGANVGLNIVSSINANNQMYHTTIMAGTPTNLKNTIANIGAVSNTNSQFLFFGFDHGGKYIAAAPRRPSGILPPSTPVPTGGTYSSTFSLEDPTSGDPNPNPDGELFDTDNEEDTANPPGLTITYDGLDANAIGAVDVLVNGDLIGTLDPTMTSTTLAITPAELQDGDSIDVVNTSNEAFNVDSETFDSGALPPEDETSQVPEPTAAMMIAIAGTGLLVRTRRVAD